MLINHPSILNLVKLHTHNKLFSSSTTLDTKSTNLIFRILMHASTFSPHGKSPDHLCMLLNNIKNSDNDTILYKYSMQHNNANFNYHILNVINDDKELLIIGSDKDSFCCNNLQEFSYLFATLEKSDNGCDDITVFTITYGEAPRELINEFDAIKLNCIDID